MRFAFNKKIICVITVFILALCIPFSSFAFDNRYLSGSEFWSDRGETCLKDDNGFCSMTKYVTDKDEDCVYFYIDYTCGKIKGMDKSNVRIAFYISNSNDRYVLYVGEDGFEGEGYSDVNNNFDVSSNFSQALNSNAEGKIFIAVKFKGRDVKDCENQIEAQYFCGDYTHDLLDEISFDISPETTITTTKSSTASKAKPTTSKASGSASSSSSKTTKKYTPAQTKFSGNDSEIVTKGNTSDVTDESYETTSAVYNYVGDTQMSNAAKVFLACAAAVILTGIILVIYGVKKPEDDGEELDEESVINDE